MRQNENSNFQWEAEAHGFASSCVRACVWLCVINTNCVLGGVSQAFWLILLFVDCPSHENFSKFHGFKSHLSYISSPDFSPNVLKWTYYFPIGMSNQHGLRHICSSHFLHLSKWHYHFSKFLRMQLSLTTLFLLQSSSNLSTSFIS